MMDDIGQTDALDWIKSKPEVADGEDTVEQPVNGHVVLQGRLGIAETEAMYHFFSKLLHAQIDISIEAEDLSRVDTAGVQLLYGLVKEAERCSIALKWVSVSDALQEASDTLGLSQGMGFQVSDA